MSVSKTILIGNLGQDPEVKYLPNGDAVCNFTLATSEKWKDKQGQPQEKTEWHRCVVFKRPAEIIGEFARKGSKMYIEGKNETRKWQSKSGEDHYSTEVKVREFQFLSPKSEQSEQVQQQRQDTQQEARQQANTMDDFDDDIPF